MFTKPCAVLLWLIAIVTASLILFAPKTASIELTPDTVVEIEEKHTEVVSAVRQFLESKGSPLAPDTEHLTSLKHWRLLIAISAIESQYCKRQLGYNCWGIGGDSAYRHYGSYQEAATDADALITRWQERGRWLTVEDMNCHYVVPCNQNWVNVVNQTLNHLNEIAPEEN